ncbi:unnamed protein product [Rotaria socialis]|uniref:Uncharacterized protein n=1 Tax=Rotaria socialis TaxID=392032 RepID=A0A821PZF1_9BILA|nr:unnamed protein product [Rotaria socialis]CAF3324182.1 unnamed protein product [Rotaria socialis]CAF3404336.1 unnamed protein product [Rotaria socialis]CAF4214316.1 unnamed protein product [Rotaria socialis]CAF4374066.1 unnamed protein product [Rotaria socialis]
MESPPPTKIKTIHAKEVAVQARRKRLTEICTLPVRIFSEIVCVVLLFTILAGFLLSWTSVSNYVSEKIRAKIRLAPDSDGFQGWLKPPVETIRTYRLYNITNYMDIMTNKSDPLLEFQETKPLRYKLSVNKNNVEWLENNEKLKYSLERLFTRAEQFSEELLNQEGAFIDILRVMIRTNFGLKPDQNFYTLTGLNAFNYSKAVDKLEGYVSPIFENVAEKMIGPNKDKYGFIYRYNGSNGFNYTILTGAKNSSIKGQMIDFASAYSKFTTSADQWNISLFDGTTYPVMGDPPNRKVINIFQPDFCRPVQLRYVQTVSKFGFDRLHEYVLKFVDYETCPEMDENCPEADRVDITKCLSTDLPPGVVVVTKPHMYGHNSSATNVAFTPDAEKHESAIYFEPTTGTPIRGRTRIQMNVNALIDRIKYNKRGVIEPMGTRATLRFIPILWIDQSITLNADVQSRLKSARRIIGIVNSGNHYHRMLKLVHIMVFMFSLIGIIVMVELFFWNRRRKRCEITLYQDNEPEKTPLNRNVATPPPTA